MFWKVLTAIALFCKSVLATDYATELATSPSFVLLTGTRPKADSELYSVPTGKFKVLADDIIKRIQSDNSDAKPQAWAVVMPDSKGRERRGLIIAYPVSYELRIESVGCDTCPNSLFRFDGHGADQKWIDDTLETWLRLNHGWDNPLAHSMLRTREVIQVKKDTRCVEFKYDEVKHYTAKVNGLNQNPPRSINKQRPQAR